jgi:hypothetical protein
MIVTHTSPDWDAIGAVWLLKRYGGLADHDVAFVNTGNPDPALLAEAAAVVDTGREYDPARLRFDHHQWARLDTCAAWLVFEHLAPNGELVHLAPLNALILQGDTGGRAYGAEWSRLTGIHALLSIRKAGREPDAALLAWGLSILDDLDAHLRAHYTARATLEQYTVYRSADGLVRGLRGAPQGATFAAYDDGARLVLFTSESEGTVSVGVMRGGESQEPHTGHLVNGLLNDGEAEASWAPRWDTPEYAEMARWFRHPAGFFAGRGTAKAPDPTPLTADFTELCRYLDEAWKR